MTNAIQKAAETSPVTGNKSKKTMQDYIKTMQGEIAKALPSVLTPERFTRITLSALSTNPTLAATTPKSFLGAMMTAAQLGVEPNTPLGQAYLIPYRNHGTLECQFQLGYKGLIDLAYRSGQIKTIQAQVVHENDVFEVTYGTDNSLLFKPKLDGDAGKAISVWAMFQTKDGGYGYEVMSMDAVREFAKKYSKAYSNGPWQTNFEEMAKKTVLKKTLKYAPLSSDFKRGLSADETIKTDISDDMFALPDETLIESEGYTVDGTSGEVVSDPEKAADGETAAEANKAKE